MRPRYLTKSRFKLALECPTKLFYDGKIEYANQKIEDTFLLALAEGGFQVGELAKQYFPGGHEITTHDYDEAIFQTSELLKLDHVIIFEAAFRFENLFIRADIVIKKNNTIELLEVKAKSTDDNTGESFCDNKGYIASQWKPYLYDVAFQKYVVASSFPEYYVSAYLMLADKNSVCPTDGLNQKFKVVTGENKRKHVSVSSTLSDADLSNPILCRINVDQCCSIIYEEKVNVGDKTFSFIGYVKLLSDIYSKDEKFTPQLSNVCGGCEYRASDDEVKSGFKSGFHECWKEILKWTDNDFEEMTVLDIWNFRKKNQCINEGRIKICDVLEDDISPKKDDKLGISQSERQWLQVQKVQKGDDEPWIDSENLLQQMNTWIYPLHFIDFETSMVAIPFNKGRHPYEGIAFQFSHHIVNKDGSIEHHGQFLNTTPGVFPNYLFIRSLKSELEHDNGNIFRYALHENTYLNMIYRQLKEDKNDIPDRDELCRFIREITQSRKNNDEEWIGSRNMVDMYELVKRFYYDPAMKGSNSIKQVLPAIINSSKLLQEKYAEPIYGIDGGISSLNFKNWKWIEFEKGKVIDPYKLLPKMFQDISEKDLAILSESDELKEGGDALTAYARLQFEEMTEYERSEIRKALLKYCELDTFAMVMIYEGWKDLITTKRGN